MSGAARSSFKPYKGTASYQVEDSELFFGREVDADQLLARVLSARMTLLHAQSGAGKTSLVNATLIPELERRSWTPVRILPHNDPVASARNATLLSVMPPPATEVAAVDRVLQAIPDALDGTIGELLERYDSWPAREPRKRALIEPVEDPQHGMVVPFVCRLLRSTIDIEAFCSHLAAVRQGRDERPVEDRAIDAGTPLRELRDLLGSPDFTARYKTFLAYLDPPSKRLWPFLQNLLQLYGARRPQFSLILVFDQFEEMFTRFVDPGKAAKSSIADLPDWRLRYEFFEQLDEVYHGRLPTPPAADGGPRPDGDLPSIRFLISMRSEYIAQLGPVRQFAPEIEQSVFHLQLLSKEGALQAVQEPARLYGYRYTEGCYNRIVNDLTKEDRYVEPAHLSLICEKLWDESGRKAVGGSPPESTPEIGLDVYEVRLHGAKGILRAFLRDYLKALPDDAARNESLEILEPLITGTGTRNIVERRQLVEVPFRNVAHRQRLLQGLVDRTIVRIEVRLGAEFVEITHEFLIPSIQEAMQDILLTDVEYQRLRTALQTLRGLRAGDIGTDLEGVLTREAFATLHHHRDRIEWTPSTSELMLRASIFYGRDGETIGSWSRVFAEMSSDSDVFAILERVELGDSTRDILSAEELRALNAARDTASLSPTQATFVLRSQIVHGGAMNDDDIRYWAKRAVP
jgi:hypothetical protein